MAWKLEYLLRPYKTCNLTVGFSKYELNNKLLGGVTFFKVTSGVTWTQPYISKFVTNFDKSTAGLYYLHTFFAMTKFHGNQRLMAMSSTNFLDSSFSSLK